MVWAELLPLPGKWLPQNGIPIGCNGTLLLEGTATTLSDIRLLFFALFPYSIILHFAHFISFHGRKTAASLSSISFWKFFHFFLSFFLSFCRLFLLFPLGVNTRLFHSFFIPFVHSLRPFIFNSFLLPPCLHLFMTPLPRLSTFLLHSFIMHVFFLIIPALLLFIHLRVSFFFIHSLHAVFHSFSLCSCFYSSISPFYFVLLNVSAFIHSFLFILSDRLALKIYLIFPFSFFPYTSALSFIQYVPFSFYISVSWLLFINYAPFFIPSLYTFLQFHSLLPIFFFFLYVSLIHSLRPIFYSFLLLHCFHSLLMSTFYFFFMPLYFYILTTPHFAILLNAPLHSFIHYSPFFSFLLYVSLALVIHYTPFFIHSSWPPAFILPTAHLFLPLLGLFAFIHSLRRFSFILTKPLAFIHSLTCHFFHSFFMPLFFLSFITSKFSFSS
ncbi:unnamed protein product [Acanthosepion pharaonis]|uniref:Uncharacterized protein n=1 Tax=Acanthosepion pharaonis TaxID=158019 RepID=A0A812E6A2_ACAPH|nr:unnamed protein product [Sepia pharaonis]